VRRCIAPQYILLVLCSREASNNSLLIEFDYECGHKNIIDSPGHMVFVMFFATIMVTLITSLLTDFLEHLATNDRQRVALAKRCLLEAFVKGREVGDGGVTCSTLVPCPPTRRTHASIALAYCPVKCAPFSWWRYARSSESVNVVVHVREWEGDLVGQVVEGGACGSLPLAQHAGKGSHIVEGLGGGGSREYTTNYRSRQHDCQTSIGAQWLDFTG
jgi:hypothetical protein